MNCNATSCGARKAAWAKKGFSEALNVWHMYILMKMCAQNTNIKFLNKNKVMITLATAHPSKFIDSVQNALGNTIVQPDEMKELYFKKENVIDAPNEVSFFNNYLTKES